MDSHIYKVKNAPIVYKLHGKLREWTLQEAAGDCAVRPGGRILYNRDGEPGTDDFLMDLTEPLNYKTLAVSELEATMQQMIHCVENLSSTYRITRGDIKPDNMLKCNDSRLHFCNFAEAKELNEDLDEERVCHVTINCLSPNRCHFDGEYARSPPTIGNGLYGLGLRISQLFTRRFPFEDWYEDDIVEVFETEEQSILDKFRKHMSGRLSKDTYVKAGRECDWSSSLPGA